MKGLIQQFPSALLPLLNIKASETPPVLDETVQPTLEMLPFYTADRLETLAASQTLVATLTSAVLTVPTNEYWILYGLNAIATVIGVGALVKLSCGFSPNQDGISYFLGSDNRGVTTTVAGELVIVPGPCAVPFILRPGSVIFASNMVVPGGAFTYTLNCRAEICRLRLG